MSLTFLDLKLYFFYWFWSLLPNFPLYSHWSVLPIPFPASILLLSGICLSTLQWPPIIWCARWSCLRLSESWADITFWIWGRPSMFLPDGKSPCTFIIFETCSLLVIYFLVGNGCSRLLSCCCCFLITLWLTFWWWVWMVEMSCERSTSLSSLLSQVSTVSLLKYCCCVCCCCCSCCCFHLFPSVNTGNCLHDEKWFLWTFLTLLLGLPSSTTVYTSPSSCLFSFIW